MKARPPSDLPGRVACATSEQQAAIERFLAGEALPGAPAAREHGNCCCAEIKTLLLQMSKKVDEVRQAQKGIGPVEPEEVLEDDALRRIYGRVIALANSESGEREVSLKGVFDCYCGRGLSARKTAAALGCSKATVMSRLAELKTISGVAAHKLRTYQPTFERIEQSLRDPRARRACGKHAALGEEADQ